MSMQPSSWTITCSAWECTSGHRPLSRSLVVDASTRTAAVRAARLKGWVPTALLNSGGSGTESWWCPAHVQQARRSLDEVTDPSRREQLLAWYDRAEKLRRTAGRAS
jgi:hypothetical protein